MGPKLRRMHAWNAWLVLALAVTGIALYAPALRGATAPIRVALKQGHIWLGIASIALLLAYVPFLRRHAKQLRGKAMQASNLSIVLVLLVGWSVSGVVLWLGRAVPPVWTSGALLAHDLLTWVGVPYAILHSVTRSRWVREGRARMSGADAEAREAERRYDRYDGTRRKLLLGGAAALLAAIVGPGAFRWLTSFGDQGGVTAEEAAARAADGKPNGQELLEPLPESNPPIGGGAEGTFRIYTVTPIPKFEQAKWSFAVNGLVDRPLAWDWASFAKLPRKAQVSDFHCVTGWSVYHATWEGIPLKELLALAGVRPNAAYAKFYSGDGVYTDALSLEQAGLDDVMVAALLDGRPIPEDLGGPVRLIVPRMYAYKSVKWLQRIELIDRDHIGYWQERGYEVDAWVPGANRA